MEHRAAPTRSAAPALYRRFEENHLILEKSFLSLSRAAENKETLSSGAEWLLDNYHIIREQVQDIQRDFPRGYCRSLPKLIEGEYKHSPRVYHIALKIIAHTDSAVDKALLTIFIEAYQTRTVLTIGELWAVPIMLRFALIENLRRLALTTLVVKDQRKIAEELVEEIIGPETHSGTDILLMLASKLKENPDFLTSGAVSLMQRLRGHGPKAALTLQWLEERLKELGQDPEEMARIEHHTHAANQISIGNTVTSLRRVSSINWPDWFEGVSTVDKILQADPGSIYQQCDFSTRDSYRQRIETLSRSVGQPEVDIAGEVVAFAERAKTSLSPDADSRAVEADKRIAHVGYYLIDKGRPILEKHLHYRRKLPERLQSFIREHAFLLYSSSITFLALAMIWQLIRYISAAGGSTTASILGAVVFGLLLSDLACNLVQWLATHTVEPRTLPKLDFESGIPESCRTIVTVQAIFHDTESIDKAVQGLEVCYLANDDPNILFALLADLQDAPQETLPEDSKLLEQAQKLTVQLNERHFPEGTGRFLLLFRHRLWSASEGKYMGWERKRGKVAEFNRLVLGDDTTTLRVHAGEAALLQNIKYVITLDSDSRLPRGVGKKLVGTIAHPLNRPVFDTKNNTVVEGYAIIQPRVGVALLSAQASRFADIFSGHSGLDPYTQMVSDVYQDLFQQGSYVGKGIYDVRAFERALRNRVPENSVLSHDLFEECFARVALAADIEIFDDFPSRYHEYAKRMHRWVRGDWQLLPWIFGSIPDVFRIHYRSPITGLGRWKLLDNLRRSLVAPASFLSLCLALTVLPGSPLPWLLVVLLAIAFPVYANIVSALFTLPPANSVRGYVHGLGRGLPKRSGQVLLMLSFLPSQAFLMMHAITVTLYRLLISKRKLLEWEVAYYAERRLDAGLSSFFVQLAPGIGLTGIAAAAILAVSPARMAYAAPFLLLWTASPLLARWLSKPPARSKSRLTSEDRDYLLSIAWQTWSYFDRLITDEHNYLIPDNIQLVPRRSVAERTSPTNISLSILSVISAYDLGFLPLHSAIERSAKIFRTLAKLERFHGHFLNWYQTKTLAALNPRYVSTVDSGNLLGHFIAARQAFKDFDNCPFTASGHWQHISRRLTYFLGGARSESTNFDGHVETLLAVIARPPANVKSLVEALEALACFVDQIKALGDAENYLEVERVTAFKHFLSELEQTLFIQRFVDWYPLLDRSSAAIETALQNMPEERRGNVYEIYSRTLSRIERGIPTPAWLRAISDDLETIFLETGLVGFPDQLPHDGLPYTPFVLTLKAAAELVKTVERSTNTLIHQIDAIISEVDLRFLYNSARGVFSIGYHIDEGQRDNSFYDLLASEARLASFVAIASGEIPQKHWFNLGRSLVDLPGAALVSWSGTMFEYLMPLLVMHDYPGTLLSATYRRVVQAQQQYARKRGVPWGISESSYSAVDFEKTYQYKAFGVPALGLKRGLIDNLVIAPYATFLALMVEPLAALKNIKLLERQGLRGEFGFYEAADFTPERLTRDESSTIVRSFFGHHQGMTLVSINNALLNGIMQQRFHADPSVRATDLLLQERFPDPLPAIVPRQDDHLSLRDDERELRVSRGERFTTPHSHYPRTRIISNGHYTVMVDNAGNGFSAFDRDLALTRWREDSIAGQFGTYIFIRDLEDGKTWSAAYQPTCVEPELYEVLFNADKIEFKRRDFGILLHTEITVSPEDNVEVRHVTIMNLSGRKRRLEVTSYGEVALAPMQADAAHPAYSKMFIESEFNPELQGLIFSRRPRSKHEKPPYLMHLLALSAGDESLQYETSRLEFLGRGNTISTPAIFKNRHDLSRSVGTVLDPVFALRTRIAVEEGETEALAFVTGLAESRAELTLLAQSYRDPHSIVRAFEMAWSHSSVELRHEHFSIGQIHSFQHLATAVLYNVDKLRGGNTALFNNRLTQSGFWRFGVSGDLPIVLLRVNDPLQANLVKELLMAHQYLRMHGVSFDLVIVNEYPGGYFQTFQQELEFMIRSRHPGALLDNKGGVFLRTQIQLSAEEVLLLEAAARVVLSGAKGSLAAQLKFQNEAHKTPSWGRTFPSYEREVQYPAVNYPPTEYEFFNGTGGFIEDGKSYQIELAGDVLPPLPWSNVIANPHFGFLVTESGGGYTWSENSRENKITPWSNDPISDSSGEVIYLRDADRGTYWSPTPRPIRPRERCRVQHSFGQSRFIANEHGIASCLTISGSPSEKIKWWQIMLTNGAEVARTLEIFLYLEWALGVRREESSRFLVTGFDEQVGFLYALNNYNNEFAGRVAYIAANHPISSYTTSRQEFIGRHGSTASPHALDNTAAFSLSNLVSTVRFPIQLSGRVGSGFDSCGVLMVRAALEPGQKREVVFCLGEADSLDQARQEALHFRSPRVRAAELKKVNKQWDGVLSAVQVHTPDRAFDIMLNGWLLYQNLSCRIYGRSALYQSGGAIGFRDQLQDVLALLYCKPDLARSQILLHASRQFPEGDVQHWWHCPTGRGVRTRISDDYLWLPYTVNRYLEVTADHGILDEQVSFIEGPKLEDYQMEAYMLPQVSPQSASLYEHCIIALDRALKFGKHGLPFIGAGDWNDGMNEVGKEGKGESVWLAWFLCGCLSKFSRIADEREDKAHALVYARTAEQLLKAIDRCAWDGEWYVRAYFDDGTPLGSADSSECKIDSLAQSWSVITGGGEAKRQTLAMDAARRELVRRDDRLICLLTPPFSSSSLEPGYIKGYPPGIRENGGQYTHAAAWVIMATALQGKGNEAHELFSLVNPINHTLNRSDVQRFKSEPYVLSADVYSVSPHIGRAGWSWYTGSAGWMYQVGLQHILGLKLTGEYFTVEPCIPSLWKGFSIALSTHGARYDIQVHNPDGIENGVCDVEVDGRKVSDQRIMYSETDVRDERTVRVDITMGA